MAQVKAPAHDTTMKVKQMGTHSDEVVKFSSTNVTVLNPDAVSDKIVIAKDEDGLYMTVQSIVDSGLLDGFKVYNREKYPVTQTVNEAGETVYNVTANDVTVTI